MNEIRHSEPLSDVPWPTSDRRMPVANTSMLPGSEKAPSPADGRLSNAREGAHDALDHMAGRAAPAAQRLGESMSTAQRVLRDTREQWSGSVRSTVDKHPLAAIAAALALGAVITRITRWGASAS
jgi:hypothetical protein